MAFKSSFDNESSHVSKGAGGQKKSHRKKGRVILISSLVLLVVGGSGSWVVYQRNHNKAVREAVRLKQVQASEADAQLKKIENAFKTFSTLSFMEEVKDNVSPYDLNGMYVKNDNARVLFANSVAQNITVVPVNNDGSIKVTYPNWEFVSWVAKNVDQSKISELAKGLPAETDSDYKDRLIDVFSTYISDNLDDMLHYEGDYIASYMKGKDAPKPFVSETISGGYQNGKLTFDGLSEVDKLVFSSDELHKLEDIYSGVTRGVFGSIEETKTHAEWVSRYNELVNYIGNLENYLGLKNADEPPKLEITAKDSSLKASLESIKNLKEVEPTPYTFSDAEANPPKVMPYGWIGYNYRLQDDSDNATSNVSLGDGSYDSPYTIGTPFTTKMMGTDGNYHDVKVTLVEVLVGDKALNDIKKYDTRNDGFGQSDNVLATIKFKVENLEDAEITVNSEFTLADKDKVPIDRTGNMYGLPERATIPARGVVDMADWFYSDETETSLLMWGKTFNHQFDEKFFNALGDEVYDAFGRSIDRKTKKIEKNKAQEEFNDILKGAQEKIKQEQEYNN